MNDLLAPFSDPVAASQYAEGPPRFVPGFSDLHRMTAVLLAERAPADARVLVLGAGGGLELKALAQAEPKWTFDGVDPAGEMLKVARTTLGPLMSRVALHEGYIEDAPQGPFDAGACLLTLHFLTPEQRRDTLTQIRRRLKPGAPFVAAHSSFPQGEGERDLWLSRYAAFAVASGVDSARGQEIHTTVAANLCMLEPNEDAALMQDAGFSGVSLFYAAFTWRGWVAYA